MEGKNPLADIPPEWPDGTLRKAAGDSLRKSGMCVVALDDDPTGNQAVHDAWLAASWDVPLLRRALRDRDPALFILTNSRGMGEAEAVRVNREAARNLFEAAAAEGRPLRVVSRSDSTLRGHFPAEPECLREAIGAATGRPPDGTVVVPAFPEGGRITVGGIHYAEERGVFMPVAETPFARDEVFGFHSSRLPDWIEEKTGGKVRAADVVSVGLETMRRRGPDGVAEELGRVRDGRYAAVDAVSYRDLEVLVAGVTKAEEAGRSFLFRTGASFVKAAAGLEDRPLLSAGELVRGRPPGGGLLVVGSHVPGTTAQVERMRKIGATDWIELDVRAVMDPARREGEVARAGKALNGALGGGRNAVLLTSRKYESGAGEMDVSRMVSAALVESVRRLGTEPRYVIGKGGITSSDLATGGLGIRMARILGQVRPGIPVWKTGGECRWPGVPLVVFPGNVGGPETLHELVRELNGENQGADA